MGGRIESFRDLKVYQVAFKLQQEIFKTTKSCPKEEQYSLTDQIRRASRSIGANLAEAWQKRRYQPHFVSKLTDSDAETAETQHWLDTAVECKDISHGAYLELIDQCKKIGKMLGRMISTPEPFCRQYKK